jgi:two-component system, response regulator YesN
MSGIAKRIYRGSDFMRMHTVLIVDGELSFCNILKSSVDWDSLNLQCAGIVVDCREAYNVALKKRPDIIIADIHTPFLEGLDLVEKIHKSGLECKFIIFSEEKTFDHIYRAIKLGCNDFLLKPVDSVELNNSLRRICGLLTSAEDDRTSNAEHNQRILLRRQFLQSIARNEKLPKTLDIKAINTRYKYNFQDSPVQFGVLWMTYNPGFNNLRICVMNKLLQSFHRIIKPACHEFEMASNNNNVMFILNYSDGGLQQKFDEFSREAVDLLKQYPELHFVAGLGRMCDLNNTESIARSYLSAKQAVASRIINGFDCVIDANKTTVASNPAILPKNDSGWKEIGISIDVLDKERFAMAITLLCRQAEEFFKNNPCMVYGWYKNTISVIVNKFKDNYADSWQAIPRTHELLENCTSINALTGYLKSVCISAMEQYLNIKKETDNKTIKVAKTFICDNIHRRLDLDTVANKVYLSPSYFGILFSKETGTTFTDYLFEKRMVKAREYLQDIKYNISEIANMTGYKDPKYFSRQFKKYFGVNPAQYRTIHNTK